MQTNPADTSPTDYPILKINKVTLTSGTFSVVGYIPTGLTVLNEVEEHDVLPESVTDWIEGKSSLLIYQTVYVDEENKSTKFTNPVLLGSLMGPISSVHFDDCEFFTQS